MKKQQRISFVTILAASVLIGFSTTATAQASLLVLNKPTVAILAAEFESVNDGSSNTTTVDERASKNFSKEFAGVTNATWGKANNGYVVRFVKDGIVTDAFLTKKGNSHTTFRYYHENELPAAVRKQVKSAFADFNITAVKEIHLNNLPTVYLITITGLNTWKEISVADGEMEVRGEYVKG